MTALLLLLPVVSSCSEKAEEASAQETADQMESAADLREAERRGRDAAKYVVNNNWTDSMQLQNAVLQARAENSEYEMAGKKKCKEHFDSAFYSTIRTVRPDLADKLQR